MNKQEALARLDALDEEAKKLREIIEKLESDGKRWRAKKGEDYYYLADDGGACEVSEEDHPVDSSLFKRGNYFKTREECEAYYEYLLALQKIKDYIREENAKQGWAADWSNRYQHKYIAASDHRSRTLRPYITLFTQSVLPSLYGSKETIENAIVELEDEYMTVFNYKG